MDGRLVLSFDRERWGVDVGGETAYARQSGRQRTRSFVIESQDELQFDVRARRKRAGRQNRGPQPFVRGVYDTEFTPTDNLDTGEPNRHEQTVRGSGGVLLTPGHGWSFVELGGVVEEDLAYDALQAGVQVRADFVRPFGPLGRILYRTRNDAAYYFPTSGDSPRQLGLSISTTHELVVPLVDELSLTVTADVFIFRGKVPETEKLGASAILRVGLTYDRLWKPRYQPFF